MPKTNREPVHSAAGLEIIEGLSELCEVARSGVPLASRFTIHEMEPEFRPKTYAAEDIRTLREDVLKVSPEVFARFLGVSPRTVHSWEKGLRVAGPIARRFMEEIAADPKYWRNRVRRESHAESTVGQR